MPQIFPPDPAELREVLHIPATDRERIADYITVYRAVNGHLPSNSAIRAALALPPECDVHATVMSLICAGHIAPPLHVTEVDSHVR